MSWGDDIRAAYVLPTELEEILQAAEQARERWLEIRAQLDREGLMIEGRYDGVSRINPLVSAESRCRESFIRAVKALQLPELPEGTDAES